MSNRVSTPKDIQAKLLVESRRRCCMCAYLNGDWSEKRVQIAHINHDSSDSSYDNLVALCLEHHNEYDAKFNQTKNYLPDEIKAYKLKLIEIMDKWDNFPHQIINPSAFAKNLNSSTINIYISSTSSEEIGNSYRISPFSIFSNLSNPNGELYTKTVDLLYEKNYLSKEICKIGTIKIEGFSDNEVNNAYCLLLISDTTKWQWSVLLFSNKDNDWILNRYFYFGWQRGEEPRTVYIPGNPNGIFGIEHTAGTGTGIYVKSMEWYKVNPESSVLLFTYSSYAVFSDPPGFFLIDRELSCDILYFPDSLWDGAQLEFLLKVTYTPNSCEYSEPQLFSIQKRLILKWDHSAQIFVPTTESEATFDDVEDALGTDYNNFVLRNYSHLKELALNGTVNQKEFIKIIAGECKYLSESEHILNILGNKTEDSNGA